LAWYVLARTWAFFANVVNILLSIHWVYLFGLFLIVSSILSVTFFPWLAQPRVVQYLFRCYTLGRIWLEYLVKKCFYLFRVVLAFVGQGILAYAYSSIKVSLVLAPEGDTAGDEQEENDTQSPDVHALA